jgi:hypothetical protein
MGRSVANAPGGGQARQNPGRVIVLPLNQRRFTRKIIATTIPTAPVSYVYNRERRGLASRLKTTILAA